MGKPNIEPSTGVTRKGTTGPQFTTLIGTLTHCEDPAQVGGPPTNRYHQTITRQEAHQGNVGLGNLRVLQAANAGLTGSFDINNNTFAGTEWTLFLGDQKLQINIDWIAGASAVITASNIVAAVNGLGGPWAADNTAGTSTTVDVTYGDAMNQVRFLVEGRSTVANIDTVTPSNGFMAAGDPDFAAPVLT